MATGESKGAGPLPDRIIPPAEHKSVSTNRIIADVSRAMDLAGIAATVVDKVGMGIQQGYAKTLVPAFFRQPESMAMMFGRRWTDSQYQGVREFFGMAYDNLVDGLYKQLLVAIGGQGSARIAGLSNSTVNTLKGYEVLFDAICDTPYKYGVLVPAERYWRQKLRTGVIKPDDAFLMYKKGLLNLGDVETAMKEQWGYTDSDMSKMLSHMDYDPASREILRVMQLTDAPLSWARKKLKALGMNAEDENYFIQMLANQTVESERNALQSALISDRVWGNMSEATFKSKLAQLALRTEEIDVLVSVANTKRSYNLINMQRDTQVYLYRKDKFNADELYRRLWEDVLIETDVANAITSLEAAKKGIEWTAPA